MLQKFDFHDKWIQWVMQYISMVTYSIQINGHRHGYLLPSCGLKQGDTLSPYLFLFCMEGLAHTIKHSALQGISISWTGLSISHLMFANDTILFSWTSIEDA